MTIAPGGVDRNDTTAIAPPALGFQPSASGRFSISRKRLLATAPAVLLPRGIWIFDRRSLPSSLSTASATVTEGRLSFQMAVAACI